MTKANAIWMEKHLMLMTKSAMMNCLAELLVDALNVMKMRPKLFAPMWSVQNILADDVIQTVSINTTIWNNVAEAAKFAVNWHLKWTLFARFHLKMTRVENEILSSISKVKQELIWASVNLKEKRIALERKCIRMTLATIACVPKISTI